MTALANMLRVLLASGWTVLIGTPLIACLYARYLYGRVAAFLGREDLLDRVLERNAWLAGWVAQRLWSSALLAISRIRLRTREVVPIDWTRPHVICANHASIFDILALVRVVPPPFRFVAKRELVKWPIVGWALRPAGQIVVDRSDSARARRSISEAAVRKIRGQVIFFVEGTRTPTGQLLPFKKGAFYFAIENQIPVLPTAVAGSYAALAKAPWWQLHPGREIEIIFLAPIAVSDQAGLPAGAPAVEVLLGKTREKIAAALAND